MADFTIAEWQPGEDAEPDVLMLADLLMATVAGNGAVSFLMPLKMDTAAGFWRSKVLPSVRAGTRTVMLAWRGGCIVGTVQMDTATPPNQTHRADLAKLLVHPSARRMGIARALMLAIEDAAKATGRTLLTLDTRTGDAAEPLYRSLGYVTAGVIPDYSRAPYQPVLEGTTIMYKNLARFRLRIAKPEDADAIWNLIQASVRQLQATDYSEQQREGALGTVFGVDTQLIADETYYLCETMDGVLVGCGGWSKRKTLFGSDAAAVREPELLDPVQDAAKIRAFFVHPDWARKGVGTMILEGSEASARSHGFVRFEMGATLTGEKLYAAKGYRVVERLEVPLKNGARMPILRMVKEDHS